MTRPELLDVVESPTRIYEAGDADLPDELRNLLIRMLSNHLENTDNPHYLDLVADLWRKGIELAPDESLKVAYARLLAQEIEHGALTARILDSLGAPPVNQPIKQYLFHLPIDTFCDLGFFHALGDRVGLYIGETWSMVPYGPLKKVAPKLHKDELFHTTFGMRCLRRVCETQEGLAEANDKVKTWWPAVLDMFGRSDSNFSEEYVRWGIRNEGNERLRQRYSADTRPLLAEIGIEVPDDLTNRRYL